MYKYRFACQLVSTLPKNTYSKMLLGTEELNRHAQEVLVLKQV